MTDAKHSKAIVAFEKHIGHFPSAEELVAYVALAETIKAENLDDKAENKFNPSQPRDEDGQWSDGGGSGGYSSPLMSKNDAKEAAKDSAYKEVLYHGTTGEIAEKIKTEGFKNPEEARTGSQYGDGLYFSRNIYVASSYAPGMDGQKVASYINVKKPYVEGKTGKKIDDLAFEYGVENKMWESNAKRRMFEEGDGKQIKMKDWHKATEAVSNDLFKTHDALVVQDGGYGDMVIVRDAESIKPFKLKGISDDKEE